MRTTTHISTTVNGTEYRASFLNPTTSSKGDLITGVEVVDDEDAIVLSWPIEAPLKDILDTWFDYLNNIINHRGNTNNSSELDTINWEYINLEIEWWMDNIHYEKSVRATSQQTYEIIDTINRPRLLTSNLQLLFIKHNSVAFEILFNESEEPERASLIATQDTTVYIPYFLDVLCSSHAHPTVKRDFEIGLELLDPKSRDILNPISVLQV